MKVKALLLAAALATAITPTTIAQIVSPNAVAFVNQTVPAGRLAILAIPLNGTSNNALNTTMPLPAGFADTTIYRFDVATQNYRDAITWFDGFGWFSPSDANPTVNPGEGIWVYNPTPNPLPISFLGDVPQGEALDNSLPGNNNLKLISSIVPRDVNASEIPGARPDDTIYVWDVATQNYKDAYTYFGGFGWFSANPDDPGPQGPLIPVGTGLWIQRSGAPATWRQRYNVSD
jgi:hypothetical protein